MKAYKCIGLIIQTTVCLMNTTIFKNKFFPLRASLIRPFAAFPGVRGMHIQLHPGSPANERIKPVRNAGKRLNLYKK